MKTFYFTVPGKPIAQERPYVTRHGTFDRPRSRKFKKLVGECALIAIQEAGFSILEGDIEISISFYGLRKNSDLDNAIKAVLDGMNNVAYKDDRQIVTIHAYREEGTDATFINIKEL